MSFVLHPRLAADAHAFGAFELCLALLMDDAQYPWVILVPQRAGLREVFELPPPEQRQLWAESDQMARAMMSAFGGDKFNLAALGNVVEQLHVHHIVRRIGDPAWPRPVWGVHPVQRYAPEARRAAIERLCQALPATFVRGA